MFRPIILTFDITPIIRSAVEQAEKQYPNKRFTAHVEMTEDLKLVITVTEDIPNTPEVLM